MSSNRRGVDIIQEIRETVVTAEEPLLVPTVVGVCRQIIETTDGSGSLNADAKYALGRYNQSSMFIPQADFPDPRDNIDELDFENDTIGAALYFGGTLRTLARASNGTYGSALLKLGNLSRRAALRASEASPYAFDATVGDPLTFALDVVNPLDTSSDVTVTLVGSLTAAEVATAINNAAGADVAEAVTVGGGTHVQISSVTFGAKSSVTLRAGTSALAILFGAIDDSLEYRVEGAGFRGQDDEDNDLTTPWIEFHRGGYFEDSVEVLTFDVSPAADVVWAGQLDQDGTFNTSKAAAVTFTGGSATFPLRASASSRPGDQFWADGTRVGAGEVIKVEQSRFKVGKLNVSLSTFDSDGNATNRVYNTVEVNTPNHNTPFAPKYAYFVADGLTFGNITPVGVAATLSGTETGLAARSAYVQGSTAITFPANLASLTIDFQVTEDGVEGDAVTYTFAGGPYANIAALVAVLQAADEFSQFTVTNQGNQLVLLTTKTGADQAISIKSTGTANTALGFSTLAATEDTGKDVEFAVQATLTSDWFALPMADVNKTFELIVEDSKGTHTLSAAVDFTAAADLADVMQLIAEAFGDPDGSVSPTIYDGGIPVATLSCSLGTDTTGTITLTTIEGGTAVTLTLTAVDETDGFRFVGFHDDTGGVSAQLDSLTGTSYPIGALSGATIAFTHTKGVTPTVVTGVGTAGMGTAADAQALAILLNSAADFNGITAAGKRLVEWFSEDGDIISVRSIEGGITVTLDVAGSQPGFLAMGFDVGGGPITDTGTAAGGNADDVGADSLKSTTLGFYLDDNPFEYLITFDTNSLQDAIDGINALVDGAEDVATEDAAAIVMTSLLAGAASKISIDADSTADTVLGLTGSATGSGRPNPDFYLDDDGAMHLGPNILRNRSSGIPFSLESALADLYISYWAIRLDVTASAVNPALLTFDTVSDMEDAIGPISTDNPLALAMSLMMGAAPEFACTGLGIDEVSAAAPMGTLDGWLRALELLESAEVYAFAPMTDDEYVQSVAVAHVLAKSDPVERGERIAIFWGAVPDRAATITVSSGTSGVTNGTEDSFTLDVNPGAELVENGIEPSDPIDIDANLYLELVITADGSSSLRRYSVSEVNGVVLTLRSTFASTENTDGFFTTTPLTETLTATDWALKIRGDVLVLSGSTRPDKNARAAAAAEAAAVYATRRAYYAICNAVDISIDGVTQRVPGYYACAVIAGLIAQQPAQQPFTNMTLPSIGRVYGTDDTFSENQLDVMTDGGRLVLSNLGGRASIRAQVSTSTTSTETIELSITKAIDALAKGLRRVNRVFIGRFGITSGFLDQLTLCNEGYLDYVEDSGLVRKADLTQLLQDTTAPDTILEEVEVTPIYPCNKIRITIIS